MRTWCARLHPEETGHLENAVYPSKGLLLASQDSQLLQDFYLPNLLEVISRLVTPDWPAGNCHSLLEQVAG
jgi:hypothetical protein